MRRKKGVVENSRPGKTSLSASKIRERRGLLLDRWLSTVFGSKKKKKKSGRFFGKKSSTEEKQGRAHLGSKKQNLWEKNRRCSSQKRGDYIDLEEGTGKILVYCNSGKGELTKFSRPGKGFVIQKSADTSDATCEEGMTDPRFATRKGEKIL